MPLIKACLLPHSPLLVPEIGRANYSFLGKTAAAYEKIAGDIQAGGIETLIIISPHGAGNLDYFTINVAPKMEIDFKEFGFIASKEYLEGDALLADSIKNLLRPKFPLRLISEKTMDHGSAVPAYLIKTQVIKAWAENKQGASIFKIITISPPADAAAEQENGDNIRRKMLLDFGRDMRSLFTASDKKIAVIASGDLSHRLKKKSPGGYSPKGAKFDNKLIEYLSSPEDAVENIMKMDAKMVNEAGECGLDPLVILLGILENYKWQPEILDYHTEFGVGYLSLDFELSSVLKEKII